MEIRSRLWYNTLYHAEALFLERSADVSEKRCDNSKTAFFTVERAAHRWTVCVQIRRHQRQLPASAELDKDGKPMVVFPVVPVTSGVRTIPFYAGISILSRGFRI